MHDLFFGYGVAHTILLLFFVMGGGLYLGRFKVKGISLGSTWVLFLGILMGHLGFQADLTILHFVKEFGLILFVFSIGLQVGPGFFHSFKSGGVKMNLLAAMNILLAVVVTWAISAITGENLNTMVGVMSGAVTNTPGLGAAQQTFMDVATAEGTSTLAASAASEQLAQAYAVAYPLGVIGVIAVIILGRAAFRINPKQELDKLVEAEDQKDHARRMHVAVENPAIFGKKLYDVLRDFGGDFVVSRILHEGHVSIPNRDTVFHVGDQMYIVCAEADYEAIVAFIGPVIEVDWDKQDQPLVSKRVLVTNPKINGKSFGQMHFSSVYGVNVTRVTCHGMDIFASPSLPLQVGDRIMVVGPQDDVDRVANMMGNSIKRLDAPNIATIFVGIIIGIIFGSLPFIPGMPLMKLGIAGGPLIIAILIGRYGYKMKLVTYTTTSANMMLREIGLVLFLASVGIKAGANFFDTVMTGDGVLYVLTGFLITIIPILIIGPIARRMKFNYFTIAGMLAGTYTDPPALAYANSICSKEAPAVGYSTVYPLAMFLRILTAQLIVLFCCGQLF